MCAVLDHGPGAAIPDRNHVGLAIFNNCAACAPTPTTPPHSA